MEQDGVGAVQECLRGFLEVFGLWVEYGEVEVGLQEAQDAVGFDDGVLRGGKDLANPGMASARWPCWVRTHQE